MAINYFGGNSYTPTGVGGVSSPAGVQSPWQFFGQGGMQTPGVATNNMLPGSPGVPFHPGAATNNMVPGSPGTPGNNTPIGGAPTAPGVNPQGTSFSNQFGTYNLNPGVQYFAQGQQPSGNAGVFTTQGYIQGLNQNGINQYANINNSLNGATPQNQQAPTSQAFQQYWNALTNGGTGYNGNITPAMFGLPGGIGTGITTSGSGSSQPAPGPWVPPAGWQPQHPALQQQPGNAFSPQGSGGTLPNLFGQGGTGTNSGTNVGGGGGNIFGGSSAQQNGQQQYLQQLMQLFGGVAPQSPYANGPNPTTPIGTGGTPVGAQPGPQSPDQALAALGGSNMGYLTNIAQNAGNPVDSTSAWQSAIAAMQRNTQENAANLSAQFDTSGNRFSSAYGTAMTDYYNQAAANQNSLIGQYAYSSGTDAQNRLLSAAGLLGQSGQQALSQLSSQNFQSQQLSSQEQLQAALAQMGYGSQAATSLNNTSAGALQGLNQNSLQALLGLNQTSSGAINSLNTNAVQGAFGMYGAQNQAAQSEVQNQQFLQQLLTGGASNLSTQWNQGLATGGALGQQQYGQLQNALSNAYSVWNQAQPTNNPLLSMLYGASTGYPATVQTGYTPSTLGSLLGGLGGLLGGQGAGGGLSGLITGLGGLFSGGAGAVAGAAGGAGAAAGGISDLLLSLLAI